MAGRIERCDAAEVHFSDRPDQWLGRGPAHDAPARANASYFDEASSSLEGGNKSHKPVTGRVRFDRIRVDDCRAFLAGVFHGSLDEARHHALPAPFRGYEKAHQRPDLICIIVWLVLNAERRLVERGAIEHQAIGSASR